MEQLPNEIISEICQRLDLISLFQFSQTCHRINKICQPLKEGYNHLNLEEIPKAIKIHSRIDQALRIYLTIHGDRTWAKNLFTLPYKEGKGKYREAYIGNVEEALKKKPSIRMIRIQVYETNEYKYQFPSTKAHTQTSLFALKAKRLPPDPKLNHLIAEIYWRTGSTLPGTVYTKDLDKDCLVFGKSIFGSPELHILIE